MSAIAGKVAITLSKENEGNWSADITYEKLVSVKHNNNLYISRKISTNIEPPNDEYWFLALEGFSGDDVQELIEDLNALILRVDEIVDGTTPVAKSTDADTVDGWHIYSRPGDLGFTSPLTMAELCAAMPDKSQMVWANVSTQTNDQVTDTPSTHGILTVVKRGAWCYATWIRINAQGKVPLWAGSWHSDNGWTGWSSTDDYLPLTGGTLAADTGSVTIGFHRRENNSQGWISKTAQAIQLAARNTFGDGTNERRLDLVDSSAIGISKALRLYNVSNGVSTTYDVHHTANKPTGTYTGNGSTAERTIDTGGIGSVLAIWSEHGPVLVTPAGGFQGYSGPTIAHFPSDDASFSNGTLKIVSKHKSFNQDGSTYYYQVL